jgi:nucleoside-diphosphate-sugar epimerase
LDALAEVYCDAIIGHTGFVGAALSGQHSFPAKFNSRNVETIFGQRFETLVCAAAPGSMLEANSAPERDRAAIEALTAQLSDVKAQRFVLISSIAVLADFAAGDDEDTQAFQEALAYGRHRRMLEAFCETRFDTCLVVRLPALFGQGLRKNFVFDLMNPVPTLLPEARFKTLL